MSECINYGTLEDVVNVTNIRFGGIVGDCIGVGSVIKSINKGRIIGGLCCGGIAGHLAWTGKSNVARSSTIKNCYNLGTISSDSDYTGGIVGRYGGGMSGTTVMPKANIINCYNIGSITKSGIVGKKYTNSGSDQQGTTESLSLQNNYWLSTCGATYGYAELSSNDNAEPKTESEMKSDAFVELLNTDNDEEVWVKDTKKINKGYPILKWQTE